MTDSTAQNGSAASQSDMPPLPRDSGSSLMSEVLPINSKTTRFWKSKALIPSVVVVGVMLTLFLLRQNTVSDYNTFAKVVGFLILFIIFYGIYLYTGSRRPVWIFAFPFAFTSLTFLPPLVYVTWLPIAAFFRDILPGGAVEEGVQDFSAHFISHFFGAGMAEETLKILPVLIMVLFGYLALQRLGRPSGRLMKAFEAVTPLDCLLAGMASGAAFIMFETFGQYYANQLAGTVQNNPDNPGLGLGLGIANALQLSIARSLQGIVGHMAWNGILGYFIGIGLHRKALFVPLAAFGLLIASTMHGFWNSNYYLLGNFGMIVSAATTLVFFLAVLLKARQLEPKAAPAAYEGSIVVQRPQISASAPVQSQSPIQQIAVGTPVMATAQLVSKSEAVVPSNNATGIALQAGSHTVPLTPGQTVSFSGIAGLPAVASSFSGIVTEHPDKPGIMGLKNLGAKPWMLFSASGISQTVDPNRSARLETGTRIVLGDLVVAIVNQS